MKLFVSEGNPHCLKVLSALEVTGVQCDVQYVNHEGEKAWLASSMTITVTNNDLLQLSDGKSGTSQ